MALTFDIHRSVGQDLRRIRDEDPDAWAEIVTVLQEFKNHPEDAEILLQNHYGQGRGERYIRRFGVQEIGMFRDARIPRHIWRFKIWKLENQRHRRRNDRLRYRIVYGFFRSGTNRRVHVLGVFNKEWKYAGGRNPFTLRLCTDYDDLLWEFR